MENIYVRSIRNKGTKSSKEQNICVLSYMFKNIETLVDIANALDISADFILADCINVHESVSGNEFSEQLKGCSLYECRVILDVTKAIKESLRENAFIKRTAK